MRELSYITSYLIGNGAMEQQVTKYIIRLIVLDQTTKLSLQN